ncbi:MAG TPA: AsnC family transcriptional regulator [Candidatus Thermoplasmatota archaeon]|nr:AsnC family transcriptional regulator [Candidatus Thermoplasmatota archaeon]
MDDLDVRILRAMGVRPYGRTARGADALSSARLAEQVGVTDDTVRARVARMESAGLIAGYRLAPNLHQMGLTGTGYYFDPVDGEPAKLARAIVDAGIPGIMEVHAFLGRGLCVELAYATDKDRLSTLDAIGRVVGSAPPVTFHAWTYPEVERTLSALDWRIVEAMRGNARRPLPEVADEISISAKTVKRRFERMAEEGSVLCVPLVDLSKAQGVLLIELLVHLTPGAPEAVLSEVVADLAGHVFHVGRPAEASMGNADIILAASSPAEVEKLRERVASRPGVSRADAMLVTALEDHAAWLDARLQALARP